MEQAFAHILEALGTAPDSDISKKTPHRAADALRFLTSGYDVDIKPIIAKSTFDNPGPTQIVVLKDISLASLCEHHLLPFFGKCHIGYLPGKKLIGLSALTRIVDCFAKRLQTQEKLTQQIAECLMDTIDAHGVGVQIVAEHFCLMMRGMQKQGACMKTATVTGALEKESRMHTEFLQLIA